MKIRDLILKGQMKSGSILAVSTKSIISKSINSEPTNDFECDVPFTF
jgi:hypothetical protein